MSDLLIVRDNTLDIQIYTPFPNCFLTKLTVFEVETVFSDEELSNAWKRHRSTKGEEERFYLTVFPVKFTVQLQRDIDLLLIRIPLRDVLVFRVC